MADDTNIQVDKADVLVQAPAPPVAPSIPMPDHEVRTSKWYQVYVRLARPSLEWAGVFAFTYATIVGPVFGTIVGVEFLLAEFAFLGALFGLRSYEKVKGVA